MILDLNKAESSPFEEAYEVCVSGSGPAGITVARELARRGVRVLLLEAGGFEYSPESQAVYQAESIGPLTYYGVDSCRLRMFGGTSNHWSGRCGLFDEVDFEDRDIWGLPGWPITYAEAYRRLEDACDILDIADQRLERKDVPHWKAGRFLPSAFARSAPTRFGEKYRGELESSKKIDVAINANVLSANLADDGRTVASLTVSDYRDRKFTVRAGHFVLALGSLENARFLLNAAVRSGVPIGDAGGFVGRCFMEHFDVMLGRFITFDSPLWDRDGPISLNVSSEITKSRRLGNAVVTLSPGAKPRFFGRLAPFRRLANDFKCGAQSLVPGGEGKRAIICRGDGLVSDIIEQIPNPDSRVVLDRSQVDRFGQYRIAVDWRLAEQDARTIRGIAEEVGKALAEQNVGRLRISASIIANNPQPGFHCHQMGTTRMSDDPKFGVVDRDLKVHGMNNLHLAGSSVFATGGGVNPTLTLTCLALRLGEHLAGKFVRP